MRHEAGRRIDGDGRDLLRRVVRDLFDLHAALGRGDDGDSAALTVDEQREVELLVDVDAVGDVEPLDLLARGPGLNRHQRPAEHFGRMLAHLVDRMGEAHAALRRLAELLEFALAASAGVDLRLDDPQRSGKLVGRVDGLLDAHRGVTGRNRYAVFREQFLGLIFVDVHGRAP